MVVNRDAIDLTGVLGPSDTYTTTSIASLASAVAGYSRGVADYSRVVADYSGKRRRTRALAPPRADMSIPQGYVYDSGTGWKKTLRSVCLHWKG